MTSAASAMIVLPAATATPAEPGGDRISDGLRTDRRQIEAAILDRLWRLDQNADALRRRHPPLPAQIGDAQQHIVGTFRRLDREHVVVGDDHRLAHVERPQCRDHIERARNVGPIARRRLIAAQHAFGNDDSGATSLDANDPQPASSIILRDPGQQPVVAAAKRANDARHQPDRLPIKADLRERRPQHRADEQYLPATLDTGQPEKSSRLPDRNPMMGVALDHLGLGPTLDGKHHRPSALPCYGVGDRAGKAAAAADDRHRIASRLLRRPSIGSLGCIIAVLVALARRLRGRINGRLPPARMNPTILPTSGSSAKSRATASIRSASRPPTEEQAAIGAAQPMHLGPRRAAPPQADDVQSDQRRRSGRAQSRTE